MINEKFPWNLQLNLTKDMVDSPVVNTLFFAQNPAKRQFSHNICTRFLFSLPPARTLCKALPIQQPPVCNKGPKRQQPQPSIQLPANPPYPWLGWVGGFLSYGLETFLLREALAMAVRNLLVSSLSSAKGCKVYSRIVSHPWRSAILISLLRCRISWKPKRIE
jgi:hypothetical protein